MKTRLTELLGLRYPLLSAPMAGHSGGRLAAAVSDAGGLGLFGTATNDVAWLRDQVGIIRESTDKPFGVGFLTHWLPRQEDRFAAALAAKAPVLVFSFADPAPWIARAKDAGAVTICQVQTMAAAQEAVNAGSDVLIAQGNEAGGHTGGGGLLPLLEEVLDSFPDTITVAAGGIASGRTLAAVLAAGADGAMMGTRFLATPEATEVTAEHKRLIVEKSAADTTFTAVYDILRGGGWPEGIAARVMRNDFAERWRGREDELQQRLGEAQAENAAAAATAPLQNRPVYMGTGVSAITAVQPVATVMQEICDEAERLLQRAGVSLG